MAGIWGYLAAPLDDTLLAATGGAQLRELRLLRCERLDALAARPVPEGFRVRPAEGREDHERLAAVYNRAFSGMWNFRPHEAADVATWFESGETEAADCLILERVDASGDAPEAAGLAVLSIDAGRMAAGEAAAYLPDIGIVPECRRLGLGGVLLAEAARRAMERGAQAIELIVDEADAGARAFYRKAGFSEGGAIFVYEWLAP